MQNPARSQQRCAPKASTSCTGPTCAERCGVRDRHLRLALKLMVGIGLAAGTLIIALTAYTTVVERAASTESSKRWAPAAAGSSTRDPRPSSPRSAWWPAGSCSWSAGSSSCRPDPSSQCHRGAVLRAASRRLSWRSSPGSSRPAARQARTGRRVPERIITARVPSRAGRCSRTAAGHARRRRCAAALLLVLMLQGIFDGAMRQVTAYLELAGRRDRLPGGRAHDAHVELGARPATPDVRLVDGVPGPKGSATRRPSSSTSAGNQQLYYVIGYNPSTGRGGPRHFSSGRAPGRRDRVEQIAAAGSASTWATP